MNVEGTERIAFRFTRGEIAALLKLMNAPSLPEMNLPAAAPDKRTELSLVEDGVVMPCGERTLVDGTVAAVMRNVLTSRRRLLAASEKGRLALYRGAQMCVLAEENGPELVTLEPFPDVRAARRPFFTAADALGAEAELTFSTDGDETPGGAGALQAMYARFEDQ